MPLKPHLVNNEPEARRLCTLARREKWPARRLAGLTGMSINWCNEIIRDPNKILNFGTGRKFLFSYDEERSIALLVVGLNEEGWDVRFQEFEQIIINYALILGKIINPGTDHRHLAKNIMNRSDPKITLQKSNKRCKERFDSLTSHQCEKFFKKVEKLAKSLDLWDDETGLSSEDIWDWDEIGFMLNPEVDSGKLLFRGGGKFATRAQSESKTQITTNMLTNMAGRLGPSLVLYAGKSVPEKAFIDPKKYPGSRSGFNSICYGYTDNGWMTEDACILNFQRVYIPFSVGDMT